MATPISKPNADEHLPYYARYIDLVPGVDAMPLLTVRPSRAHTALAHLSDARGLHRYETGKWSVKDVILHMTDCERVMSHRALRFARADLAPLPGFDENAWAPVAAADARTVADLVGELAAVRAATVALFASLDLDATLRRGEANGAAVSVRALAWIIAGHEIHHLNVLRDRYGVGG